MYWDGPTTKPRELREEAGLPPVVYMVRSTKSVRLFFRNIVYTQPCLRQSLTLMLEQKLFSYLLFWCTPPQSHWYAVLHQLSAISEGSQIEASYHHPPLFLPSTGLQYHHRKSWTLVWYTGHWMLLYHHTLFWSTLTTCSKRSCDYFKDIQNTS